MENINIERARGIIIQALAHCEGNAAKPKFNDIADAYKALTTLTTPPVITNEEPVPARGRMKNEDVIEVISQGKDKKAGTASGDRWADSGAHEFEIGARYTVEELLDLGLIKGDIVHEIKVRKNWVWA